MKDKIVGFGEIGKGISQLLNEYSISEKEWSKGGVDADIIHICIPWGDTFIETVGYLIRESKPICVIIHSTVKPGTTKQLQDSFPKIEVVHSPVIGVHPNLREGLKTFPKWIGFDKECIKSTNSLISMGIKPVPIKGSHITETLKVLSTTYYGVCIAFHQLAEDLLCDDVNYLGKWNEYYNEGYTTLGMPNVVRPILYPPGDKIGGHCVIPNAKIIKEITDHPLLDGILKYE